MPIPFSATETLRIRKGETFSRILRWEDRPIVYKVITGASKAGPCVLTVPTHGLPDGWAINRIVSILGMKQLNTHKMVAGEWVVTPLGEQFKDGLTAGVVTSNSIELNEVNASSYDAYTSGGVIEYFLPKDLTDFAARMQIRDSVDSDTVLLTLTSDPATGSVTGSIEDSILTVTAVGAGSIVPGQSVSGTGVTAGTVITEQITGDMGDVGTYYVNVDQAVDSTALTLAPACVLTLDNTAKTITREIPVATVDLIDWETGVATLEMTDGDGIVTLLIPNEPVVVGETDVTRA